MKNSGPATASQAAQRLGTFMRALHHETKHTPGISRSLDTIRRRVASWTPRSSSHEQERPSTTQFPSNMAENGTNEVGTGRHAEMITAQPPERIGNLNANSHDSANANESVPQSQDFPPHTHPSSAYHYSGQDIRGSLNFGDFLDTGSGFHPDAFPWTITDLLNVENNSETIWGPIQSWD
jgi:hypothetical protein